MREPRGISLIHLSGRLSLRGRDRVKLLPSPGPSAPQGAAQLALGLGVTPVNAIDLFKDFRRQFDVLLDQLPDQLCTALLPPLLPPLLSALLLALLSPFLPALLSAFLNVFFALR